MKNLRKDLYKVYIESGLLASSLNGNDVVRINLKNRVWGTIMNLVLLVRRL